MTSCIEQTFRTNCILPNRTNWVFPNWPTLILTFDGLTFELAFEHSVIKSLTLKMTLKNRDSGIKSRTKAYWPRFCPSHENGLILRQFLWHDTPHPMCELNFSRQIPLTKDLDKPGSASIHKNGISFAKSAHPWRLDCFNCVHWMRSLQTSWWKKYCATPSLIALA